MKSEKKAVKMSVGSVRYKMTGSPGFFRGTHESLDKVLTESVSLLRVDPTLNAPSMITFRSRTGQDHDLEG